MPYAGHVTALVRGVFVCVNCGVTPVTFLRILHVVVIGFPLLQNMLLHCIEG